MIIKQNGNTTKLLADEGKKITNKDRTFFSDFIYLGKNDSPDNYVEVGREIWKHFIEEENPDVKELQNITRDLQSDVEGLKSSTELLNESQIMADETANIIMSAVADSDENHERLTDVILLAIDQMYLMLEPIIWNEVSVDSLSELPIFHNVNKEFWEGTVMVELYAVMVQRGLKTIDQVPARYRARVEELLANVE